MNTETATINEFEKTLETLEEELKPSYLRLASSSLKSAGVYAKLFNPVACRERLLHSKALELYSKYAKLAKEVEELDESLSVNSEARHNAMLKWLNHLAKG